MNFYKTVTRGGQFGSEASSNTPSIKPYRIIQTGSGFLVLLLVSGCAKPAATTPSAATHLMPRYDIPENLYCMLDGLSRKIAPDDVVDARTLLIDLLHISDSRQYRPFSIAGGRMPQSEMGFFFYTRQLGPGMSNEPYAFAVLYWKRWKVVKLYGGGSDREPFYVDDDMHSRLLSLDKAAISIPEP